MSGVPDFRKSGSLEINTTPIVSKHFRIRGGQKSDMVREAFMEIETTSDVDKAT
jgi:hypothetical protein